MIKRLVIHRFRGIRQGTLEDFGKINVLIGPNNSGKTAILEMLYLAGVSGRECEVLIPGVEPSAWKATTLNRLDFLGHKPFPRLRSRHGEPEKGRDTPAVRTNEYTLDVELAELSEDYPIRRFALSAPPETGGHKPLFEKEDEFYISLFRLSPHINVPVPKPMMPTFFNVQKVTLENMYWTYLWEKSWVYRWDKGECNKGKTKGCIDHFAVWALEGKLPASENVLLFDFHSANQHFRKEFTQQVKDDISDWYDKIAASLSKVFPEFKDAEIEIDDAPGSYEEETGYIRFSGRTRINIDHFGDGARHAFKVLAALIALRARVSEEKPGLFLWEDPELFMHPATLGRLLKEVIKLVKDVPIQVFLTTQSLEVIAHITRILQTGKVPKVDIRAFSLLLEKGELMSRKFRKTQILKWLESGFDLRDTRSALLEVLPFAWKLKTEKSEGPLW